MLCWFYASSVHLTRVLKHDRISVEEQLAGLVAAVSAQAVCMVGGGKVLAACALVGLQRSAGVRFPSWTLRGDCNTLLNAYEEAAAVDTSGLRQWKLVAEIRYPGSAAIFDKRGHLAQSFGKGRSLRWRMADNRVQVHDENRQLIAFASHDNAGVMVEEPPTVDFFHENVARWFGLLIPELWVSRLNRIAVRSTLLLPQPDFGDLTGMLKTAMYGDGPLLWQGFGLEPVDLGFALTFEEGTTSITLQLGPMKKAEIVQEFESERVSKSLPEVFLYVDFDYFEADPEFDKKRLVEDITQFVRSGCDQAYERTSALLASIGE